MTNDPVGGVTLSSDGGPFVPDISVLMCTYNRSDFLADALDRIVAQETAGQFSFEVVVVDNGSTDDTRKILAQMALSSEVPIRCFVEPMAGVAHARNRSVRESRGRLLVFVDDDELVDLKWLQELYRTKMESGAEIVGGSVLLGLAESEMEALGRECRRSLRERDASRYGTAVGPASPRGILGTGNLLVDRMVFEKVGLFDATVFMGGEDADFLIRARLAGFKAWYTPKSIVYHRIPKGRISAHYLRRDSLQSGALIAYMVCRYRGKPAMLVEVFLRIGQAAIITAPLMTWAVITGNKAEKLDRQIKWWRMKSFVSTAVSLMFPRIVTSEAKRQELDFRDNLSLIDNED